MGLYDDEDVVGSETALAERMRVLNETLTRVLEQAHASSRISPDARVTAIAELVAEAERAIGTAELPAAAAARRAELGVLHDAARTAAAHDAAARRAHELDTLRTQLQLRLDEIAKGQSLRSVAATHVAAIASRLRALGDETLAREAEAASLDELEPAVGSSSPAWADVEAAITLWIHERWHEATIRVAVRRSGLGAQLAAIELYDVELDVWTIAASGVRNYHLHPTLVRRDGGWTIDRCAVVT